MKKTTQLIASAVFALTAMFFTSAHAASTIGTIDSLQLPAFLDRGGLTVPATPGIELLAGDKLRTGRGARMIIALNEGSLVRLGENATFEIVTAERKAGVYNAALNVLEGAFRFTTKVLAKAQPRNVNIRVGNNATIGIRGTDLWGRGSANKDIVCLIEGKIDVTGNNNKTIRLDQPLQFFQSTRTAPPEPISLLDQKQLEIWARETDLEAGKGAKRSGVWKVNIAGFVSRDAMLGTSRLMRDAGYPVEKGANNTLTISRLGGEGEAKDLAAKVAAEFTLGDVRISK